ncbi:MAG: Rrf2 family transcriptional regulator [Clostridia bacterium]|nr:Rrf2 family transcriptional regulator [Clostridia bacterium]
MKITTKGRYALRMLLDLAEHADEGFVTLKAIAERQDLSKKYLEQIIPVLNSAWWLVASRGFQGGYRLAKAPAEYSVKALLELTEGGLAPVACLEGPENRCPHRDGCETLPVWKGLEKVICDYLEGITLQDILDQRTKCGPHCIV